MTVKGLSDIKSVIAKAKPGQKDKYPDSETMQQARKKHEQELREIEEKERQQQERAELLALIEQLNPELRKLETELFIKKKQIDNNDNERESFSIVDLYESVIYGDPLPHLVKPDRAEFTLSWVDELRGGRAILIGDSPNYAVLYFDDIGRALAYSPHEKQITIISSLKASVRFCVEFGLKQVGDSVKEGSKAATELLSLSEIDSIEEFVSSCDEKQAQLEREEREINARVKEIQEEIEQLEQQLESIGY